MCWVKKYWIAITVLFCGSVYSQGYEYNVSANYMQGFILPEYDLLQNINEGIYHGAEVSFFKTSKPSNYWQKLYNNPEYGFSTWHTSFGEPNILGYSLGGEYFFKINFINKKRYKLYMRSGFGLNYINKKYDEETNPLNTSMGSNINVRFNLRFANSIFLTKQIALNIGAGLDHFSNANTQYPNRGINSISFYGGLTYNFGKEETFEEFEIPELTNRFNSFATLYMGFLHTKWPNNTYYPVPALAYDVNYRLGHIFSLGVGADVFYDSSIKKRYGNTDGYQTTNSLLAGVHFSQNITYNKFTFSLQEGVYLYSYEPLDKNTMYNRIVFKWMVSDKVGVNLNTLSYLNDLEFIGTGISYQIK